MRNIFHTGAPLSETMLVPKLLSSDERINFSMDGKEAVTPQILIFLDFMINVIINVYT